MHSACSTRRQVRRRSNGAEPRSVRVGPSAVGCGEVTAARAVSLAHRGEVHGGVGGCGFKLINLYGGERMRDGCWD